MSLGEFPPLTIQRDALRRADIRYIDNLLHVRWADLDAQRRDPLLDGDSAALLLEQAQIEGIQHKLKVFL